MYPVIFLEKAIAELEDAFVYLEEKENNLGLKFIKKTEEYLSIIQKNPAIFVDDYKGVRQVRIVPFSYILRYKVFKKYLAIIQIYHSKQNSIKKRKA
ncbi:MAG: type II toxin-antitoxin system RelE/ParE family toxin [Bacteroidota bacterium]